MTTSLEKIQPKQYKPIATKEELYEHLQYAAIVELSTIPPYLTALYSLQDKTSQAYQIIRSVVIEEMLHLNLVCNAINALGYKPQLVHPFPENSQKTITYPTSIPHHRQGGPYIILSPASLGLMRNTFMAIERPETPQAPAEGDNFETIGQFYAAIEAGFKNCVEKYGDGQDGLFKDDTGFQHTKYYFGSSGGRAIKIKDLATALKALTEIKKQGEGAPTLKKPEDWQESYGYYEEYGERPDGTYGPILGTPLEMSHYLKFQKMAEGEIPLGDVYPMMPNPDLENFTDERTQQLAEIFDGCYSMMLRALELCFGDRIKPDPFFTVVVPLMQSILPTIATRLMQLPVFQQGDAKYGPNAGPCFNYTDDTLETIFDRVKSLKERLDRDVHLSDSPEEENSLLAFQQDIQGIYQTFADICLKIAGNSPVIKKI